MAEDNRNKHARNFKDLTGQRFGRLTAISFDGPDWECRCDCGTIKTVQGYHLIKGNTVSCGCYAAEAASKRRRVHGLAGSREYNAWKCARDRCANQNHPSFSRYGGRGIYMADRWANSFEQFLEDMGPCPQGLTLDRTDNDGPYAPDNCRWITQLAQCQNTRKALHVTHDGQTLSLREWARQTGIPYSTLRKRYQRGYDLFSTTPISTWTRRARK